MQSQKYSTLFALRYGVAAHAADSAAMDEEGATGSAGAGAEAVGVAAVELFPPDPPPPHDARPKTAVNTATHTLRAVLDLITEMLGIIVPFGKKSQSALHIATTEYGEPIQYP